MISPQDDAYLEEQITKYEQVRKAWDNLQRQFSKEDHQRFQSSEFWQHSSPPAWKMSTPGWRMSIQRISWAAMLLGCIGAASYFLVRHKTEVDKSRMVAASLSGKQNGIQLKLANGSLFDLSTRTDSISVDGVHLSTAKTSLSYKAGNSDLTATINTLTVPIGRDYKVLLSDGTEIWLNAATTLQFPFRFDGKAREITVIGEAFFKVAKNADMPFIIHTAQAGEIKVLGTEFNLNTYDTTFVKVALVKGSVSVQIAGMQSTITPGQQAVFDKKNGVNIAPFDAEEVLSWKDGIYYFNNATMTEVSQICMRWLGINTILDNNTVAQQRFFGKLDRNRPLKDFMEALKSTKIIEDYYYDKEGALHIK